MNKLTSFIVTFNRERSGAVVECLTQDRAVAGLSLTGGMSKTLKGTATLMISMFYQKELCEPCILIQASSKSSEEWANYGP